MRGALLRSAVVALTFASLQPALAADAVSISGVSFRTPAVLRGSLGSEQIQLNLRPASDGEDGLEGDYFVFGQTQRVLVAGDEEDGQISLEESVNGTDVSGHWTGTFRNDTLSGSWESVDGSTSKPFVLKVIRAEQRSRQVKRKMSQAVSAAGAGVQSNPK